jgi:hypothetical protein
MSNNFEITISAQDKATKVITGIRKQFAGLTAPAKSVSKAFGDLKKDMGLDRINAGLAKVGRTGRELGRDFAPLRDILAVGTGIGAAKVIGDFMGQGSNVIKNARTIGISPEGLQGVKGAASLSNLDPNSAEADLSALAANLQNARYGRNRDLLDFMRAKGMAFKYLSDGRIDTMGMLTDVSRLMAQQNDPQAQNVVSNMFGVPDIAPILRDGPARLNQLQEAAKKAGLVRDAKSLEQAESLTKSFRGMLGAGQGAVGALIDRYTPNANKAMDLTAKDLQRDVDTIRNPKVNSLEPPNRRKFSGKVVEGGNYKQGETPAQWFVPPRVKNPDAIRTLQDEYAKAADPDDRAAVGRELARMGVTPANQASKPSEPQTVKVEVHFKNAPAGVSATASAPSGATVQTRVFNSMDGLGGGR